jgi:hypothetical protein
MRFAYGGSVDRHRLLALAMTRVVRTEADRDWLPCPFHSSIFTLPFTGNQWIATPARGSRRQGWYFYHEGNEEIAVLKFVIARRERSEGRGNPSCLEGILSKDAVRLLWYSGSPCPQGARDDKGSYPALFTLHSSIFTLPFTEPIIRILFHIHHFMLVRRLKSA